MQRVTALLEERRYIPSMAGILLARNSSGIIGVFVNDHPKYEGHTLRDGFLASVLLPLFVCEASWSLGENVCAAIYGRMGTEQSAAMTLTRHTGTGDRRAVRPVAGCGRDRRKASWRRGLRWGLPGGEAADGLWRGRSLCALRREVPARHRRRWRRRGTGNA